MAMLSNQRVQDNHVIWWYKDPCQPFRIPLTVTYIIIRQLVERFPSMVITIPKITMNWWYKPSIHMARLSLLYLHHHFYWGSTPHESKWYQLNFECLLLPNQYFRFINASQYFMVSWHGGIPIAGCCKFHGKFSHPPRSTAPRLLSLVAHPIL